MIQVSHCVTRAPPSLSDNQPPTGRIKAPTAAPIQMYCDVTSPLVGVTKTSSISFGKAFA